jgi:hypothetical protein
VAKNRIDAESLSSPLAGIVGAAGPPPKISAVDLAARVADLNITLTGENAGSPVILNFAVVLNTAVAAGATAELIDETDVPRGTPATRNKKGYAFKSVGFTAPGRKSARVFRITNVRANVSALGGGSLKSTTVTAAVSITNLSSGPVRLSDAKQVVALIPSKTFSK